VIKMVDGLVIYDSVVHNPTAEEKKILDGITFKEKSEYRYKVDDKYVYYVKEDLEKNRPLIKDMANMKSMKDLVNTKNVSEELPVGAVSREMNEKGANDKELPEEWNEAFRTVQPFYVYENHAI
nr:ABC transporter permease [Bacillus pacificus]